MPGSVYMTTDGKVYKFRFDSHAMIKDHLIRKYGLRSDSRLTLTSYTDPLSKSTLYIGDIIYPEHRVTKSEMESLVYGSCFLGSGGGGPLQIGLDLVSKIDSPVKLIKPTDVACQKGDSSVFVAFLGSPEEALKDEDTAMEGPCMTAKRYIEHHDKLNNGINIKSFYPAEIGAVNTIIAFYVASKLGKYVLDADSAGRAVPLMNWTLLAVNFKKTGKFGPCPAACGSNDKQDIVFYDDEKETTEAVQTQIVKDMKTFKNSRVAGVCACPIKDPRDPEFYGKVNCFTIDLCIKLGRVLKQKKEDMDFDTKMRQIRHILAGVNTSEQKFDKKHNIRQQHTKMQHKYCYSLFEGKLTNFYTYKVDHGNIDINRAVFIRKRVHDHNDDHDEKDINVQKKGDNKQSKLGGDYDDNKFKQNSDNHDDEEEFVLYGMNESLLAFNKTKKKLECMAPDIITMVRKEDARPMDMASIGLEYEKICKDNDQVAANTVYQILGIEAWDNLTTQSYVEAIYPTIVQLYGNIRKSDQFQPNFDHIENKPTFYPVGVLRKMRFFG